MRERVQRRKNGQSDENNERFRGIIEIRETQLHARGKINPYRHIEK